MTIIVIVSLLQEKAILLGTTVCLPWGGRAPVVPPTMGNLNKQSSNDGQH